MAFALHDVIDKADVASVTLRTFGLLGIAISTGPPRPVHTSRRAAPPTQSSAILPATDSPSATVAAVRAPPARAARAAAGG